MKQTALSKIFSASFFLVLISGSVAALAADESPQAAAHAVSNPMQTAPVNQPEASETANPEAVLLGDIEQIPKLTAFKKLLKIDPSAPHYQKTRIEYLLERISRSSYNFVRDNDTYGPTRGVAHLRYKWSLYHKEVETAEDFADKVANGSRKSGKPYYMKTEGKFYPVRDVLRLELRTLEDQLKAYKKPKA